MKCLHKKQFSPLQHLFHYRSKRLDQQFHHWHQLIPVDSKINKIQEKPFLEQFLIMLYTHSTIYHTFYSKFKRCIKACHKKCFFALLNNIIRLATLLKRANTKNFQSGISKKKLWLNLCFKVGDNDLCVSTKGLTPFRVHIPAQNVSTLLRIILAVMLVLVKCFDIKMVKLPGGLFIGSHSWG